MSKMSKTNKIKILATGKYLPSKVVSSDFFDKKFDLQPGTSERKSGIESRHYVSNETLAEMGAYAIKDALSKTELKLTDIDCIVSACGVMQQPIPCTAALIQKELGLEDSGIPCFDINATCLSFVVALDTVSYMISAGKYKNVLIVSSDIASVGINPLDFKSSILFGDAACASIVSSADEESDAGIIDFKMTTYSRGADYTCIKGGLSYLSASEFCSENASDYLFHNRIQSCSKST